MRQVASKLEQLGLPDLQIFNGNDTMEGTDLIIGWGRLQSLRSRRFVLTELLLLKCLHNFLSHLRKFSLENRLKASHKCLEEGVVEDFFAQMKHLFQHILRSINVGTWILARCFPKSFVLERNYLQDYLYFRRIKPLELPLKLLDRIFLFNYSFT